MRKLAPMILMTSIAFAGAAFAADTDKVTGSPTVSPNTSNPQGTSYSDKSNTAKGTNAPMDDTAKAKAEADNDKKLAKKKMAKAPKHMDTTLPSDTTSVPSTTMSSPSTSLNSPAGIPAPAPGTSSGTNAAADNSITGKSGK
jgi:uncharacterized protein (DUF2345 family)